MNERQKIVTVMFIIVFWISCLHVPWHSKNNRGEIVNVRYATIFKAQIMGGTHANISSGVLYIWGALLITYGMVLVLCSDTKKNEIS
jgi:hypothetical protein